MSQSPITHTLSMAFAWSFWVSIASYVGFVILVVTEQQHEGISPVAVLLLILMVVAGPVWYISLGMLAKRLGRRWLVWVGLSFLTAPIGPLVTFPLMRRHIKAAQQTISLPSISN